MGIRKTQFTLNLIRGVSGEDVVDDVDCGCGFLFLVAMRLLATKLSHFQFISTKQNYLTSNWGFHRTAGLQNAEFLYYEPIA